MKTKTLFIATIVAVGCLQFAQTSFANDEQTTPSDQQNIPGVAAQPDSYFFTGKPYDAELGGYVFAARVLNPETGRWNTPDPSGFPDGANNRIYAPVPTNQLDDTGLKTITDYSTAYFPIQNTEDAVGGKQVCTVTFKADARGLIPDSIKLSPSGTLLEYSKTVGTSIKYDDGDSYTVTFQNSFKPVPERSGTSYYEEIDIIPLFTVTSVIGDPAKTFPESLEGSPIRLIE